MIDEGTFERYVDRAVERRLRTDREYLNAEDAEQQSAREGEIAREECHRVGRIHGYPDTSELT